MNATKPNNDQKLIQSKLIMKKTKDRTTFKRKISYVTKNQALRIFAARVLIIICKCETSKTSVPCYVEENQLPKKLNCSKEEKQKLLVQIDNFQFIKGGAITAKVLRRMLERNMIEYEEQIYCEKEKTSSQFL